MQPKFSSVKTGNDQLRAMELCEVTSEGSQDIVSKVSSTSSSCNLNNKSQCETKNKRLAEVLVEWQKLTSTATTHFNDTSLLDISLLHKKCP